MMYSLLDLDAPATLFNKIVTATNGSASGCSTPTTPPTTPPATCGNLRQPALLGLHRRLRGRQPDLLEGPHVAGQVVDHERGARHHR
jgi:hypothetical protein